MLPRSRFESDAEYHNRLVDELERVRTNALCRDEAASYAAYGTGYDNDDGYDPDPEMAVEWHGVR